MDLADIDEVVQGVGGEDFAFVGAAEQAAFINREGLREAFGVAFVLHVFEVTKGVRVGERAVFAPAFDAVAALFVVHATGAAVVGAGEDAAFAVDVQAEGVATAFGVDFEGFFLRMVAPDALAFPLHILGVGTGNVAGGGAAIGAVKPAVHAPGEAGGDAVGVLQTEATELHFGVAIRFGIEVGVGITEQVGRVQHPDAAHAMKGGAGDVQAGDDIGVLVKKAIAIGVFEYGDFVRAFGSAGWRRWDLVELGAQVLVVADDLEASGELVLQVLGDPETTFAVPTGVERLGDFGFGGHEVDGEVGAHLETFEGFLRCGGGRVIGQGAAAGEGFDDVAHLIGADHGLASGLSVSHGAAERQRGEEEGTQFHRHQTTE